MPWTFSYTLEDDAGKRSTMMIENWENGELCWKCLRTSNSPAEAVEKVRQKYLNEFATKDL